MWIDILLNYSGRERVQMKRNSRKGAVERAHRVPENATTLETMIALPEGNADGHDDIAVKLPETRFQFGKIFGVYRVFWFTFFLESFPHRLARGVRDKVSFSLAVGNAMLKTEPRAATAYPCHCFFDAV